jgi:hypothetical protein
VDLGIDDLHGVFSSRDMSSASEVVVRKIIAA